MEPWQWAISAGIALLGVVCSVAGVMLVVMGRDRSLIQYIGQGKAEALAAVSKGTIDALAAIELAKDDMRKFATAGVDAVHERVNRVRDEHVRRDDFAAHERRVEKALDEIKADQIRMHSENGGELRQIKQMINSSVGLGRVVHAGNDDQ